MLINQATMMKSNDFVRKVYRSDREVTLRRGRPEQTWDGVKKKRGLLEE